MAVWLHSRDDVQRLGATIEEGLPESPSRTDRIVLRTVKHLGHLLDRTGLATGESIPWSRTAAGTRGAGTTGPGHGWFPTQGLVK